jgi:chromosome segregation ATPase
MRGDMMSYEKHLALFSSGTEHQRQILTPYLSDGVAQTKKILYISSEETTKWIDHLFGEIAFNNKEQLKDQQFKAWTAETVYLREGSLNFDSITKIILREEKKAEAEGFRGLVFCLEVTHVLIKLYSLSSFKTFMNFLQSFLTDNEHAILFIYQLAIIEAVSLMPVLTAHPFIAVQDRFIKNPYYARTDQNPAQVFFSYLLQNHEYLDTISEYKKKLKETLTEKEEEQKKLAIAFSNIEVLKSNILSSELAFGEKEAREKLLEEEVERLTEVHKNQENAYKEIENKVALGLQRENEMNQQLQDFLGEKRMLEERLEEYKSRIDPIETENRNLNNTIEQLITDKEEADARFSQFFREKSMELKELEESQIEERIEWNLFKKDIENRYSDVVQQSIRDRSIHEAQLQAYADKIEQLEMEINNLKSNIIEQGIEIHRLETDVSEKEVTSSMLAARSRQIEQESSKEREDNSRKIKIFEDQVALLTEENLKKEKTVKESLAQNQENLSKIERFMLDISMKSTELQELSNEYEHYRLLNEREKSAYKEYETLYRSLLEEHRALEREKESLVQAHKELKNRIEEIMASLEEAKKDGLSYHQQNDEAHKKIELLESNINSIFLEKEEHYRQNEILLNQIKELQEERTGFSEKSEKLEILSIEQERTLTDYIRKLTENEEVVERKRKCIGELKLKIEQQEQNEVRLRKDLDEEKAKREETERAFERMNMKTKENEERNEHLTIRLAQEESLFQEVQKEIFSYKAQVRLLEDKMRLEETKNTEQNKTLDDLRVYIECLKQENQQYIEKIRMVNDIKTRLENSLIEKDVNHFSCSQFDNNGTRCQISCPENTGSVTNQDGEFSETKQANMHLEQLNRELENKVRELSKERDELLALLEEADRELREAETAVRGT